MQKVKDRNDWDKGQGRTIQVSLLVAGGKGVIETANGCLLLVVNVVWRIYKAGQCRSKMNLITFGFTSSLSCVPTH